MRKLDCLAAAITALYAELHRTAPVGRAGADGRGGGEAGRSRRARRRGRPDAAAWAAPGTRRASVCHWKVEMNSWGAVVNWENGNPIYSACWNGDSDS